MTIMLSSLIIIISLATVGLLVIVWFVYRILRKIYNLLMDFSKTNNNNLRGIATSTDDNLERVFQFLQNQAEVSEYTPKHTPNKVERSKYYPETHRKQKATEIADPLLSKLVEAYKVIASGKKFVPISKVVETLLEKGFVQNEKEAIKLINNLLHRYPKVIRIEDVRGRKEKHIAIYWEMIQ